MTRVTGVRAGSREWYKYIFVVFVLAKPCYTSNTTRYICFRLLVILPPSFIFILAMLSFLLLLSAFIWSGEPHTLVYIVAMWLLGSSVVTLPWVYSNFCLCLNSPLFGTLTCCGGMYLLLTTALCLILFSVYEYGTTWYSKTPTHNFLHTFEYLRDLCMWVYYYLPGQISFIVILYCNLQW